MKKFILSFQSENALRLESLFSDVRHQTLGICVVKQIPRWILSKSWLAKRTCNAVGHMHFSGVLISISVSELMTFPSLSVFSVVSGHKPWLCSPPYFPYCANSMEIVVPRGQLNCTYSWSQPAFWYVLKVPESRAEKRRMEINYWFMVPSSGLEWMKRFFVLHTHVHSLLLIFSPILLTLFKVKVKEPDECCQKYMKFICSHPKSYLNISRFPTFRLSREKTISKLSEIDMTACGKKTIEAGKMFAMMIKSISLGTLRAFGVEIVFNISAKCFPKTLRETKQTWGYRLDVCLAERMESESRTFVVDQQT